MSRVISTHPPGRERHKLRRTIAEALRRLAEKPGLDGEARDLTAHIVFSLWGIDDTVERAAVAWEKRNYYLKADRFRSEWAWAGRIANRLEEALRGEQWDGLHLLLADLSWILLVLLAASALAEGVPGWVDDGAVLPHTA